MDDDDDYGDFVVYISEDRGECDIALLFDARWIHGMEPFEYVERAIETAGPAFEGAWQQFGTLSATDDAKEVLNTVQRELVPARRCDLPEDAEELIVATLGGLAKSKFERGFAASSLGGAFIGYIDVSDPSEIRSAISGPLDWVH